MKPRFLYQIASIVTLAGMISISACDAPHTGRSGGTESANIELPFRPNILWLVAEDLSPILPMFGDSTVETPNLSRMAREGIRYTNVYSVSGVCAPSRYSLATGRYTTTDGGHNMRTQYSKNHMDALGLILYEVVSAPEVKMMSEILRRNGYYTTNNNKEDHQFAPPVTAWDESSRQAHWRNRPEGKPFFSIFNFGITHESQVWARAGDSLWVDENLEVPIPPYLPDTEPVRRDVQRVYSNIKVLDFQIGQRLAELEEDGLLDSTIVVFYGDHGGPLPRQKRLLYDSGLRVPLIVRFPDQRNAGTVDEQLVSFVDFAPTTFSLAGIELPEYLDGQAFLGQFRAAEPRSYIHAAADRLDTEYDMIRAVREKRYKYLRNFQPDRGYYLAVTYREQMATMQELLRLRDEGGLDAYQAQWFRPNKPEEELFDTLNDPYELNNLAADPAYADKLAELREELNRWQISTDDKGFLPEAELIEHLWPGWVQPETARPVISYDGEILVLSCPTEGASIGYQIVDGDEDPGNHWEVYIEPLSIEAGRRLVAIAHRLGYKPSEVVTSE